MNHKLSLSGLFLATALLAGCSGNPSATAGAQVANRDLEKEFSPVRFVTRAVGERTSLTTAEWAGTPGQSITAGAQQVRADILQALRQNCGLEESQLAEVRVVKHRAPLFYEVWVFKDPLSKRDDGMSGLSVVMKQLPDNGGVDFSIRGACHSSKPPVFYSTR